MQVSCFPDKTGYLIGSIEGRVAVHHVEDSVGQQKNFTFKCHRWVAAIMEGAHSSRRIAQVALAALS
jgi:hypothetical protein